MKFILYSINNIHALFFFTINQQAVHVKINKKSLFTLINIEIEINWLFDMIYL